MKQHNVERLKELDIEQDYCHEDRQKKIETILRRMKKIGWLISVTDTAIPF